MMQAIRGTLAAWWRRNIIDWGPEDLSHLDYADRLTDEQLDRLVRDVRAQAREHERRGGRQR